MWTWPNVSTCISVFFPPSLFPRFLGRFNYGHGFRRNSNKRDHDQLSHVVTLCLGHQTEHFGSTSSDRECWIRSLLSPPWQEHFCFGCLQATSSISRSMRVRDHGFNNLGKTIKIRTAGLFPKASCKVGHLAQCKQWAIRRISGRLVWTFAELLKRSGNHIHPFLNSLGETYDSFPSNYFMYTAIRP